MRIKSIALIVLLFSATFWFYVQTVPSAPKTYMGREIAQTMHYSGAEWLIRPSRAKQENTEKLLQALQLKPGMVVCDMGCGNGYYTVPIAKRVGEEGTVLAVDIQQPMLDMLMERVNEAGLNNVKPIKGKLGDPNLPKGELDMVLMVDVYHEFANPEAMLTAIRESLKPDGVVALAEFRAEDPDVPIKPLHKMSKKQILKEYTANGFALKREYNELPWQHLMFFTVD